MKLSKTKAVVFVGMVAAIYAALSLMPGLSVLSFGPVQLRIAEALSALALLTPWAIPGLTIGCFLANLASPMMAVDLPFGTLATLIAVILTFCLRKKPAVAMLMPVIVNGVIIGATISFYTDTGFSLAVNMALVALGEFAACYVFGLPLYKVLKKNFNK